MPLETANTAPLGRIDPNSLFTAPDPSIVEPRAVLAMSEAFRNGLISAEDIQQRAMLRPAQEAAAKMAADPSVVQAQRAAILQETERSRLANENAALELRQKQALTRIPPVVQKMHLENVQAGVGVPTAPENWTPEDSAKTQDIWEGVELWKTQTAIAKARQTATKEQEVVRGKQKLLVPRIGTKEISSDQEMAPAAWLEANPNPREFIRKGKPILPELFGQTPGATVVQGMSAVPAVPAVPNAVGAVQDEALSGFIPGTAGTTSATAAAAPASGMALSDVGMETKAATDIQMKSAMFGTKAEEANVALQKLKEENFNPASWSNWVQNYFYGPLEGIKTGQKKEYDSAVTAWLTGLLRLESGAAISVKEESWYKSGFFPVVGDPPSVQRQKEELRRSVEQMAMQVAEQGHLDVAKLKEINAQGQLLSKISAPSEASAAPGVSVQGVGNVLPVNAAQGVVRVNYTPPTSLKLSPVVQPKAKIVRGSTGG